MDQQYIVTEGDIMKKFYIPIVGTVSHRGPAHGILLDICSAKFCSVENVARDPACYDVVSNDHTLICKDMCHKKEAAVLSGPIHSAPSTSIFARRSDGCPRNQRLIFYTF